MANRIPPSLKWLIDKRARLDGEIQKTKDSVSRAKKLIEELSSLEADLEAIDRTLKLHVIQVETDLIPPIRSHYHRLKLPHGELTRLLLSRLRQENGAPVSTHELTRFVADNCSASDGPEIEYEKLHLNVRYRLKNLVKTGVVQSNHPKIRTKGMTQGYWSLRINEDTLRESSAESGE